MHQLDIERIYTALNHIRHYDGAYIIQNDPVLNRRIREVALDQQFTDAAKPVIQAPPVSDWYIGELSQLQNAAIVSNLYPRKTRFGFIKRVIRRIMRVYTQYQQMFNLSVCGLLAHSLGRQTQLESKVEYLLLRVAELEKSDDETR